MNMIDINGNFVYPGDKVKILNSDYPNQIGRIVEVMNHQDCMDKVKVSFSDQWQGYFNHTQIAKVVKTKKSEIDLNDEAKMFEILFNNDHPRRGEALKEIKKSFVTLENCFNYLNRIDYCDDFTNKQWFEFGVYFSIQGV